MEQNNMESDESKPPRMSKEEHKKLRLVYVGLIAAAVIGLGVVVWLAWIRPAQQSAGINSYEECIAAGHPVQEKYPEVCVTPNGTSFTAPESLIEPN